MKKFLIILLTAIVVSTAVSGVNAKACRADSFQSRAGVVTNICEYNDTVEITDTCGLIWVFYGVEDWYIGDVCSFMLLDTCGTSDITDDAIMEISYCGSVSQFVEILENRD